MMKKLSQPTVALLTACALGVGPVWADPQTPPSAPVTIVNGPTNPVPVTGIVGVEKTIVPVRISDSESILPGNTITRFGAFYTVPPGKRLIVEHISCSFFLQPPDALTCAIEENVNFIGHSTAPAHTPAGGTAGVTVATGQAVKVIFGPGESFAAVVLWGRPSTGQPTAFFTLSGFLEDAQ